MNSITKNSSLALAFCALSGICLAQSPKTSDGIAERPIEPRAPIDPAGPDVAPKVEGQFTWGGEPGGEGVEGTYFGRIEPIDQVMANNLLAANEVVIAVGRLAGERSQSAGVKQFSAQLVTDHLALSQELRRIADPGATDPVVPPVEGPRARDPRRSAAKITDALPHPTTTSETPLKAQTGATDTASENGLLAEREVPRPESGIPQRSRLVLQLADVDHRVQEENTKLLRRHLERLTGARFDKAYLCVQMTLEMQLVAALKVTHEESSESLGPMAQRGQSMAERHLKEAKDLVEQLETASKPEVRADAAAK